jgi:hypothetical protein
VWVNCCFSCGEMAFFLVGELPHLVGGKCYHLLPSLLDAGMVAGVLAGRMVRCRDGGSTIYMLHSYVDCNRALNTAAGGESCEEQLRMGSLDF